MALINKTKSTSKTFAATPAQLWRVLTDPAAIKAYLFGTDCQTTWEVGTPIVFKGSWEGTVYEDHGMLLEVVPEQRIVYTYWTSFSGLPDVAENYGKVIHELKKTDSGTELIITQEGFSSEAGYETMESTWGSVMELMVKQL